MLYLKFNHPAMKMLFFYFLTIAEDRAEIPVVVVVSNHDTCASASNSKC